MISEAGLSGRARQRTSSSAGRRNILLGMVLCIQLWMTFFPTIRMLKSWSSMRGYLVMEICMESGVRWIHRARAPKCNSALARTGTTAVNILLDMQTPRRGCLSEEDTTYGNCWHIDLGFPGSRIVGREYLWFPPLSLKQYSCWLSWLTQYTE
jgi:hypothetical protein